MIISEKELSLYAVSAAKIFLQRTSLEQGKHFSR